ncbi:MAG: MBL fold metallo-hydrolase RNA specificity domain-containing protein [Candidatus Micrarchaeota archaeon]
MKIRFLGAAGEVGRSCFLVEGSERILLDCGVKFKEREEFPLLDNKTARNLDRVVISHAHMDHSGFCPALYAAGYEGKVYLTKPTRDLTQLLLADYLRLQKEFTPYSQDDIDKLLTHTEILEYGEWSDRGKGPIRLQEAGHILGSAITELNLDEKKIIYSGDINLRSSRLLDGAKTGLDGEILIIESTYGAKADRHIAARDADRIFIGLVNGALQKEGKVLVPTFAIGRGQEILFTLESYLRSGVLEKTPIYLDGMIKKALRIYRHNAIYLKKEVQRRILTSDDDPFKSEYYLVPKSKDRRDVFEQRKAVVLATSGMLNGGPILTYLEHLGESKKNSLILVGYQAEGTRGRALLEGAKELELRRKKIEINLKVSQAPFTAHSDHRELVHFAKSIKGLQKVFVVHGEGEKPFELAQSIEKATGAEAVVPALGGVYDV